MPGPEMFPDRVMEEAARLVNYVGGSMAPRHAAVTPQQVATVMEMIEAAGQRVEDVRTPTLDDVAEALRDDVLHDEACAYWDAPADGEPDAHDTLGGLLLWLADYLPEHIDEMRQGGE